MTSRKTPEQTLADAVMAEAPAVFGEWDPTVHETASNALRIEMQFLRLYIGYNLTFIGTRLQPAWAEPYDSAAVELFWILEAIAPELPDSERMPHYLSSNSAIPAEVERQLTLVVTHCRPLLEGNVDAWSVVENWMEDWGGRKPRQGETKDDYLNRLKRNAEAAWRAKNYWTSSDFYGRFRDCGGQMTLQDRWRLLRSSRRTFRTP